VLCHPPDIRRALDKGAHGVQIDFTESRLDPSGQLLRSFTELNNNLRSGRPLLRRGARPGHGRARRVGYSPAGSPCGGAYRWSQWLAACCRRSTRERGSPQATPGGRPGSRSASISWCRSWSPVTVTLPPPGSRVWVPRRGLADSPPRTGLTREAAISYPVGVIAYSLIVLGAIAPPARVGGGQVFQKPASGCWSSIVGIGADRLLMAYHQIRSARDLDLYRTGLMLRPAPVVACGQPGSCVAGLPADCGGSPGDGHLVP
jgi:hypothetical protein